MTACFETKNSKLYINGKKVLKAWESDTGWYWFAVEKVRTECSMLNGKEYPNDTIWFGFVQGFEEEWGEFSQAELESLYPRIWEIPKRNIPYAGRYETDKEVRI